MNRDTLLTYYDRFTRLVEKLPGGLQKPILRELVPIRELFLEQRPARLLLLGPVGPSVPELLGKITPSPISTGPGENGWRSYEVPGRGAVLILDARSDTPDEVVTSALDHQSPDVALLVHPDSAPALDACGKRLTQCRSDLPVVGLTLGEEAAVNQLASLLDGHQEVSRHPVVVTSGNHPDAVAEALCDALPNVAKLEFARLSGARGAQAKIAGSLLTSFTAVCGVIGLQPIPLADMPILTSLQSLMVGMVIYTTGKPVNARLFGEFLGALGFGVGAGMVFREGARALVKVIPFWGNAISGMVAGAGTYAIGRASIAYFIEDRPIHETKKLFRRLLPGKKETPPALPED